MCLLQSYNSKVEQLEERPNNPQKQKYSLSVPLQEKLVTSGL